MTHRESDTLSRDATVARGHSGSRDSQQVVTTPRHQEKRLAQPVYYPEDWRSRVVQKSTAVNCDVLESGLVGLAVQPRDVIVNDVPAPSGVRLTKMVESSTGCDL